MLYTSANHLVGSAPLNRTFAWILGAFQLRFAGEAKKARAAGCIEPRRLPLGDQWDYLSNTIKGAHLRAEEATRCHKSAALQLDLAQYGLSSLVDELSAVMDVGGRRRQATVHLLDVQPSSAPRPFDDAIAA